MTVWQHAVDGEIHSELARGDGDVPDLALGKWRIRFFKDGELIFEASGPTKAEVCQGAELVILHEMLRRADVRESGTHECEFCAQIKEMARDVEPAPPR